MANGFSDDDYEYHRNVFLNKLFEFIDDRKELSAEEVIEKSKKIIYDYKKYYDDGDYDKDMIKNLQQDLEWYESIVKSETILKKKVKVEEQQQIKKDIKTLEFKYQTSLWKKLFNQRSFNNELYGQALLHVTIGIIFNIKVPVKRSQFIWARTSLFYVQRSRSGKNEGMYFVEDVLNKLRKNGKSIEILRLGKQTDPTLVNRYAVINRKGIVEVKKDSNGKPEIIHGKLEQSDLVWQPEANYLLNPTSYNDEAINIHLNLLEADGTYTKELEQWKGLQAITKGGNYALVAITRPVENIKKHIAYNGLLQRCIFMPRHLARQERRKMLGMVALNIN